MANRDPKFKWFRTYADIVDNAKLRLLAFEDRWHFMALCALKCDGLLEDADDSLRERKIALKMGVQLRELDEIKRRLMEVGLIDCDFRPIKWEMRQHRKPDLPDGESLEGYRGYVYFIGDPAAQTIKIGYSKNPWARVKDLQTGRDDKLSVVATVRTTDVSECRIHDLFAEERQGGEWFTVSPRIQRVIAEIKAKRLPDDEAVANYVANYVATTKDTDSEADTETEEESPKGDRPSPDGRSLKPEHVFEFYQKLAVELGLPVPRDFTPERRQLTRGRVSQYALDDFQTVFGKCRDSPFLRGDKGRTPLNFDWIMKKANFQKTLEGNYDG